LTEREHSAYNEGLSKERSILRSVFSWFRKKKSPRETSPGGSAILRHESSETRIGLTKERAQFAEARESVYERFFGKAARVFHEVIPLIPHIDVYTHDPGHDGRNFYTLVTGGMSDLEMTVPVDVARNAGRKAQHAAWN